MDIEVKIIVNIDSQVLFTGWVWEDMVSRFRYMWLLIIKFAFDLIHIETHFSGWNFNCHIFDHSINLSMSSCNLTASSWQRICLNTLVFFVSKKLQEAVPVNDIRHIIYMALEMAWRTRPLQLVLCGGPVTPTPTIEYNENAMDWEMKIGVHSRASRLQHQIL